MTLEEIRQRGLQALSENLGTVGLIRFIQQFEMGYGDYTAEHSRWLDGRSVQQLVQEIERRRETEGGPI
jgi:hypothetical protein